MSTFLNIPSVKFVVTKNCAELIFLVSGFEPITNNLGQYEADSFDLFANENLESQQPRFSKFLRFELWRIHCDCKIRGFLWIRVVFEKTMNPVILPFGAYQVPYLEVLFAFTHSNSNFSKCFPKIHTSLGELYFS